MSWNGIKNQINKAEIEAWCEKMRIRNYTINSKGEIDVDGNVDFEGKSFNELPYKFGKVNGFFSLTSNPNLSSLKNCPYYVRGWFSCDDCEKLYSLEGCPKEVGRDFYCRHCKREFEKEEVTGLCGVGGFIYN